MLGLLGVFLMLPQLISLQNNPVCKAKRYMCAPKNETATVEGEICVYVNDTQSKFHFLKPCEKNATNSYCPHEEAAFENPARCKAPAQAVAAKKFPGDTCENNLECLSEDCSEKVCVGKKKDELCDKHEDCDVSLYCGPKKTCVSQSGFDQPCRSDLECVNNCVCNLGKCAFYYSFDNSTKADNPKVCQSGYISKNNTCSPGLRSRHPGNPCTYDLDCEYVDENDKVVKTGKCTCGFNSGAFSYCPLETGDQEFADMTRSLKFVTLNNRKCHTLRRFGPCPHIFESDYRDFNFKLQKYESYPRITMNDDCVAQIYTQSFWQYLDFAAIPGSSVILGLVLAAINLTLT